MNWNTRLRQAVSIAAASACFLSAAGCNKTEPAGSAPQSFASAPQPAKPTPAPVVGAGQYSPNVGQTFPDRVYWGVAHVHTGYSFDSGMFGVTLSPDDLFKVATGGYVHVPQRPVEAVIALSIVFVAAEILRGRQGHVGITTRAPWIVALLFGLMHGLGFASGLEDAGLPDAHIPTALLFFSIGVEAGHFLFIGFVLSLTAVMLAAASRLTPNNQKRFAILQPLPPYAIGSVAMFWVIQRLGAL